MLFGVVLFVDMKKCFVQIQVCFFEFFFIFSNNVMDVIMGWMKYVIDEVEFVGLFELVLDVVKQVVYQKDLQGWLFMLDIFSYLLVMLYVDNWVLCEEMYCVYVICVFEQGLNVGKWDNNLIIQEILVLCIELVLLLGFVNYVECLIVIKMVLIIEQVVGFLCDLVVKFKLQVECELVEVCVFVVEKYGMDEMEVWDVFYYSEKLKQDCYFILDEILCFYFFEYKVLIGLFIVVEKLYGLLISEVENVDIWYKDVCLFSIIDKDGILCGQFYLDLYV